jgi:pimeloyl-ACP methyl ester carboxylesterase
MWEPVIERLAAERDVVAIDLPGFAASPPPPAGTPAGIGSLARLVGEFIDELGLARPHLAGNSLGGWLALELARQDRARSATGLSPAGFHNPLEGRFQRLSLSLAFRGARLIAPRAERVLARPGVRRLLTQQFFARPDNVTASEAVANIRALAGAAWFQQTLRALGADRVRGGGEIAVPVTIAWGEKDRLLLPRQASRAAAAVPTARLVTLTGCGHVPTYDDPEQVARVVLEGSDVD